MNLKRYEPAMEEHPQGDFYLVEDLAPLLEVVAAAEALPWGTAPDNDRLRVAGYLASADEFTRLRAALDRVKEEG